MSRPASSFVFIWLLSDSKVHMEPEQRLSQTQHCCLRSLHQGTNFKPRNLPCIPTSMVGHFENKYVHKNVKKCT